MGLFDNILGKKGKSDDMALEPRDGGYILKGNRHAVAPDITRASVFVNQAAPPEDEPELIKSLVTEFNLGERLAPDALIIASYEAMPDIDEYLSTREIPESLNAFIMARAMLKGLARGQAEMGKLAVNPFNVRGIKGVIVLKEA